MKGMAFCPAHVTGFFKAELDVKNNFEQTGSQGAGFSIQKGVKTTVLVRKKTAYDDSNFHLNIIGYQTDNAQVSEFVIRKFLRLVGPDVFVDVDHNITVPVGYGLGCSSAVALSLGLALNQALETGLSKEQVGIIAHRAEIECQTGLGDVLASYHGGFEIRTKSGAPGHGIVKKLKSDNYSVVIICFSPISTKRFISERLHSINGLGGKMVTKLEQSKNIIQFQDMSLEFAKYVDVITPKMAKVISDLNKNGINCGVAMFGETVFSLVPKGKEEKVMNILKKYDDGIIITSKIDNAGARITSQ
ncbi:MAG TPA: GHMP kinase [Nitrosopumilaceae archaeon]|nr:GHMP kinase [Nitrosopumilaceae archaeon]